MRALLITLLLVGTACGDDESPSAPDASGGIDSGGGVDATSGTDTGTSPEDARTGPTDSGGGTTDSGGGGTDAGGGGTDAGGGGSTVGMACANDTNCTGAGEVCCLSEVPFACRLEADCMSTIGGIPCTGRDDCPTSRVCCRASGMMFCTPRRACEDFGGEEVP